LLWGRGFGERIEEDVGYSGGLGDIQRGVTVLDTIFDVRRRASLEQLQDHTLKKRKKEKSVTVLATHVISSPAHTV